MDCTFRILTNDKETFEKLKKSADAYSEKGLIIINSKCDSFDFLQQFDVEMLIVPVGLGGWEEDCFYYDGEMKECGEDVTDKFDTSKYEPIIWKEQNIPKDPFQ